MARPVNGIEHIEEARRAVIEAKTVEELRAAQSVLLPLEFGLNLEQTSLAIGRSKGYTSVIRNRYCRIASNEQSPPRSKRSLRNRAYLTKAQEKELIEAVFAEAEQGGVLVIPPLHEAVCKQLGQTVSLSTVYRLLHRHGWRKVVPDTQHPKGNAQTRDEWKKSLQFLSPKR